MDSQTKRAALFLLLATGPLAEVLSENVQLSTLLQPLPFFLVTITYGVPVLLIRELAVARKLDTLGLVLLGLAYGILNEGVLAKTLTQPGGAPLDDFAGYGQIGTLQGGWTIFMVVWHAPHSVLYPILMCRWLFPGSADRRWFASGRARWLLYPLLLAVAGLYSLYFLNPVRSDAGVFIIYAVATLVLFGIALRFCSARDASPVTIRTPTVAPALVGAGMILFYVFQLSSPGRIPFVVCLAISIAIILLLINRMRRAGWRPLPHLLLFGLGDDLTFSLFSAGVCIISGRNPWEAAAAGAIFFVVFVCLMRAVRREPLGNGTGTAPLPVAT